MQRLITLLLMSCSFLSTAQPDTAQTLPKLLLSAYADVYYVYDFANPASHERPSFLYNHNRHNEVNLNLGYVKASYASQRVRAALALMAGTYAHYNLAHEPILLRHLFEAHVGLKIVHKHNLWLDAGIFTSHIGFESAVSKECWTLTRSMVAENSPYYLSGAKLTYTSSNEHWLFSVLYLNGWQRIQRVAGNNSPNLGTQILFRPTDKLTLNYSTFVGSDKPDSAKQMRHYHNIYAIWKVTPKWGLILGADLGMEQAVKGSSEYSQWYAPIAIVRYAITPKIATAIRAEYYEDANGVIIATKTPSGFRTAGYSVNMDYKLDDRLLVRMEARLLHSKDNIFWNGTASSNQNFMIGSSLSFSL